LVALYNATGGPNWNNRTNWLSNTPVATWHGVFTDANGHVTELRLPENGLRGSIPDLSALTNLTYLNLSSNRLNGQIPDMGALTRLRVVWLSDNQLTGPISHLNTLTNVTYLNLRENQLSGPIPDLSALIYLEQLNLSSNQLTGSIPDLSALDYLWTLNLSYNQLTGPIPGTRLPPDLWYLRLRNNRLTESIPDLSTHTNLRILRLDDNRLTGPIPDLSAFTNLTALSLDSNQLTGPIPDLSPLSNLGTLSLSSNELTGAIPDLSALTNLTALYLDDNRLTGSIPDLSAQIQLKSLLLNDNRLSGPILNLNHLTRLTRLFLNDNQFTGPVPDLSGLKGLTRLSLEGNRLCLPQDFGLSDSNKVVTDHLNSMSLPDCTPAELSLAPGVPPNLTPTIGDGVVTLTWGTVANAASYELRVWDSINRKWGRIGDDLTSATYTHSVLQDGRNYYYQVRAVDAKGVRGAWSEQVYAAVVTPQFPPPPVSLGLDMLYQKYMEVGGVGVVAPSEVSDEKLVRARGIITGILAGRNDLLRTLAANRTIIFMESWDTRGIAFKWTAFKRGRAYVRANDPHCENFIHEFMHLVHYAVEDQPNGPDFNNRLQALYQAALNAGLWKDRYASTNAYEYWAETARYWLWGASPETGYPTLADYDPEVAKLIEEILSKDAAAPAACKP